MSGKENYTGLLRNPSSLTWLIKQRETIQGNIDRKARRIRVHRTEIVELSKALKAVDTVIRGHETPLDPSVVAGRKPQCPRLAKHGVMGRYLIVELKKAGTEPKSTTDLAIGFLAHIEKPVTMLVLKDARRRIRWRLKDMAKTGVIVGHHTVGRDGVSAEGLWTLAPVND